MMVDKGECGHLNKIQESGFRPGKEAKKSGPTEIRTRITGFRVLGANHYTMGPLHDFALKMLS